MSTKSVFKGDHGQSSGRCRKNALEDDALIADNPFIYAIANGLLFPINHSAFQRDARV